MKKSFRIHCGGGGYQASRPKSLVEQGQQLEEHLLLG
jgi:hypothetical protein